MSKKEILTLSFPIILTLIAEPLASMIDTILIGNKSTDWLSALAAAATILTSTLWIFNFLIHGTASQIAYHRGNQNLKEVSKLITITLSISLFFGTATLLILFLGQETLISLVGIETKLHSDFNSYYLTRLLGFPVILFYTGLVGIARGLGNTTMPLLSSLLLNIINIAFSYLSLNIWGKDLSYVALGTNLGFLFAALTLLVFLLQRAKKEKITFVSPFTISRREFFQFSKDSAFFSTRTLLLIFSLFLCTAVVARIGSLELAAYQIITQITLFLSFVQGGFATVGTIKGSEFLGAKLNGKFKALTHNLLFMSFLCCLTYMVPLILIPEEIVGLFTKDSRIINLLTPILPIFAITLYIQASTDVLDGLLYATRNYRKTAEFMFFSVLFFFIPGIALAYKLQALLAILMARVFLASARSVFAYRYLTGVIQGPHPNQQPST